MKIMNENSQLNATENMFGKLSMVLPCNFLSYDPVRTGSRDAEFMSIDRTFTLFKLIFFYRTVTNSSNPIFPKEFNFI